MKSKEHQVQFCVVGGGMAGMIAAIAAARKGTNTALIQDRPVLGGCASSEIRMWISGAHGENNRETGIIEEIQLENKYRQTYPSYSVWDSILWEKARFQDNLTLLLNCSMNKVEHEDGRILSVTGWQMTTETWHTVKSDLFADCTGDGTLGAMAGAEYRVGREERGEFGESIAPEKADKKTQGMSCLIQARETDRFQEYIPPSWAYRYNNDGELPDREHTLTGTQNFWWLEVGGMDDSIHDSEELRDELIKIAYGVWDHIKNRGDHGADNWVLDWTGFLPGKRESRRLMGDHLLTQQDVDGAGKHFEDNVAFGGWTMDDHFPEGFYKKEAGTIWHPAPSPYGIPYRSLYSRNISNLFFAGRNISATHTALSSTRVMGTTSLLGQAIGTAASIAAREGCGPRGVYENHIEELQQTLMTDDCYIPFKQRGVNALTRAAKVSASNGVDAGAVVNGYDRTIGDHLNGWIAKMGDSLEFRWEEPVAIGRIRLVFDSDLSREHDRNMVSYYALDIKPFAVPPEMVKRFTIECLTDAGDWESVLDEKNNYQRLVWIEPNQQTSGVRITPRESWGNEKVKIFSIDFISE